MDLALRSFRVGSDRVEENPEFEAWVEAVRLGFLLDSARDAAVEWLLRQSLADDWLQWGCYDEQPPPESLPATHPVATFLSFAKPLNIGSGTLLPTHLISDVTVRPTHRRRGLLRRMLLADLRMAAERGRALAALTVTEATIYGRFGFAPATSLQAIAVEASPRFTLRTPATGRVELTDSIKMSEFAPRIFEEHLTRTRGALGRTQLYAEASAGRFDPRHGEANRNVRNALHFDSSGRPDGFVCYAAEGEQFGAQRLKIRELCVTNPNAYLGLWQFLARIDRVERITWNAAPIDDPLRWAVVDPRCYSVSGVTDHLWLRVLDPVVVLSARPYTCSDSEFVLRVNDALGFAEGTFRLTVRQGAAVVTSTTAAPEAVVGVEELSALFLGGVTAERLYAVGRIEATPSDVAKLDGILGGLPDPYCTTYF